MIVQTLVIATALSIAQKNLDNAISSVNGKISYMIILQGRIHGDFLAHNTGGMKTDIGKLDSNATALQLSWQQYEIALAAYRKAQNK